jgi:hypothetical protein
MNNMLVNGAPEALPLARLALLFSEAGVLSEAVESGAPGS